MQEQYAGQVPIIGVAGRANIDDILQFVQSTGTNGFPHIADLEGGIWESFGVGSQPAWVYINDDGTWTQETRSLGHDGLTEKVEELLAS